MNEDNESCRIRPLSFDLDYTIHPDGSVLVSMGDTRVIASIMSERRVPPFAQEAGMGWLTSEYSMLPAATNTRSTRDVHRGRPDGRSAEIQRLIGRSLRSVVELRSIPERTIYADCDVIQADGGTRTAALNGAFVALNLACLTYLERGELVRWPLTEWLGAVSVGVVDGNFVLDLDYLKDSSAEVDFNVVATGSGRIVEIQGTGEKRPFSVDELHGLFDLAMKGVEQVISGQREALRPRFEALSDRLKRRIPGDYLSD